MLNARDQENVLKASLTANLLTQDLKELVKSKNPLLVELCIDLLQQAGQLEQKLKHIDAITRAEQKAS